MSNTPLSINLSYYHTFLSLTSRRRDHAINEISRKEEIKVRNSQKEKGEQKANNNVKDYGIGIGHRYTLHSIGIFDFLLK